MNQTLNLTSLRLYYWSLIINLVASIGSALMEYVAFWDYLSLGSTLLMAVALFGLAPLDDTLKNARNCFCVVVVLSVLSLVLVSTTTPAALGVAATLLFVTFLFSMSIVFLVMRGVSALCARYRRYDLSEKIDKLHSKYGGALAGSIASFLFLFLPFFNIIAIFIFIFFGIRLLVLSFQWIGCADEVYNALNGSAMPE